jgi:HSP20 family molecular chaperone IbpA
MAYGCTVYCQIVTKNGIGTGVDPVETKHITMMNNMQASQCRPAVARQTNRPAMNIRQDDQHLELQFAVPGFRKEELTIRVEDQILIVEGKPAATDGTKPFVHREFRPLAFEQKLRLSERIEADTIQANAEDGVLRVTLGLKQPLRHEIAVA